MNSNQYLPENAKIDFDSITQVNISVGFAWRFYYANGETYLTESSDDKQKLAHLVNGWKLQKDIKIDIYTKPEPVVAEPQTAAYQAAVDNVWFEMEVTARNIKSDFYATSTDLYADRIHHLAVLEKLMEWALGTNGRGLGYDIGI